MQCASLRVDRRAQGCLRASQRAAKIARSNVTVRLHATSFKARKPRILIRRSFIKASHADTGSCWKWRNFSAACLLRKYGRSRIQYLFWCRAYRSVLICSSCAQVIPTLTSTLVLCAPYKSSPPVLPNMTLFILCSLF